MRTIAIDDPGVCQSVTRAKCAKTAERIDVLFGVETPLDPRSTPSHTARRKGSDATFAKLLWPVVMFLPPRVTLDALGFPVGALFVCDSVRLLRYPKTPEMMTKKFKPRIP